MRSGNLMRLRPAPSRPRRFPFLTAKMERGFSLITAVMLVLLILSLTVVLHLRIATHWRMASGVESQLYSLVLAENGIEYARTFLPHADLNSLLAGPDGEHCKTKPPQWRSPMSFAQALQVDPLEWTPDCDDGLPAFEGELLLPGGYSAAGNGAFFVRFSNNPEEDPEADQDGIVLVRSLGIVPSPVKEPFLPGVQNSVALVEARFRQEQAFRLPSPLTLLADTGSFQWEGSVFLIEGREGYAVSLAGLSESTLYEDLMQSLSPVQQERIRGNSISPSIRDAGALFLTEKIYGGLLSSEFWDHFLSQLPQFADQSTTEGLLFLEEGGAIDDSIVGMVVAKGDLLVHGQAKIEGILIHLGDGMLRLEGGAQIIGGVWMSNLQTTGGLLRSLPISLQVGGATHIRFDSRAIRRALAYSPPAQLGWRILFPETVQ